MVNLSSLAMDEDAICGKIISPFRIVIHTALTCGSTVSKYTPEFFSSVQRNCNPCRPTVMAAKVELHFFSRILNFAKPFLGPLLRLCTNGCKKVENEIETMFNL